MADSKTMMRDMEAEAIKQIANVSTLLRQAIQASIPAAPEQYLTIGIPGTTIDVRDIKEGGTFVYGAEYSAFPPTAVRQAESRLVDNMCPLSYIMVGNTGKSVSRSYSRALDGLVPRQATVTSGGVNPIRSPGEKGYDDAMAYLTKRDEKTGLTPVDIYVEKQSLWTEAQEAWDKAKLRAQKEAMAAFDDPVSQRQHYDDWNQANYRKYKFAVQGRWIDWVANGHKYDVEFNFGMVDTDSIMARVENSKESMRNSTIVDADGANEVLLVNLTPKHWATLCQKKQEGWFRRNGSYSLEQLDGEIRRLSRLLSSYETLQTVTTPREHPAVANSKLPTLRSDFPLVDPADVKPDVDPETADKNLHTAFENLYIAEATVNSMNAQIAKLPAKDQEAKKTETKYTAAVTALDTQRKNLQEAINKNKNVHAAWAKYENASLTGDAKASMDKWLTSTIKTIKDQIAGLQQKRAEKTVEQPVKLAPILAAGVENGKSGTTVATEGSELADPLFEVAPPTNAAGTVTHTGEDEDEDAKKKKPAAGVESDPWTTISVSFSAEDQRSSASNSSWGMSVGGGGGWGLWSVGGSYAHEESKSDSQSDMASCDVSVTFDALVVNIGRPWLYAELFNDFELDVAKDIRLSPGAKDLHALMKAQVAKSDAPHDVAEAGEVVDKLAQYNSFPAFPTSFIVAANTVVDVSFFLFFFFFLPFFQGSSMLTIHGDM